MARSMKRKLLLYLLLLPLLVSCRDADPDGWAGTVNSLANGAVVIDNPAEGLWPFGEGWSVREELRIGSAMGEGPDLFGRVAGVTADARYAVFGRDGVVSDGAPQEADRLLERLEWFTRQGGRLDLSRIPSRQPPISGFHVADDGHLWVRLTAAPDEDGTRYELFDPEGRYLGEVTSETSFGFAPRFRQDLIYGVAYDSMGVVYVVRWRVDRGRDRPR